MMLRWLLIILSVAGVTVAAVVAFDSTQLRLTGFIVSLCLALWIGEVVPPFVPTFLLFVLTPLLLGPLDQKFALPSVLGWATDPVLALFFGGFVLGVAASKYGFDKRLADLIIRLARGSGARLLLFVMLLTAILSMWMSNIAAAVLMLACLRPVLRGFAVDGIERRSILVGAALAANIGGISTPVGTGPNAIAIASISSTTHISFIGWMSFSLPLAIGALLVGFVILWLRIRRSDEARMNATTPNVVRRQSLTAAEYGYLFIFAATIVLWLAEPLHGVPASLVSLGAAVALFMTRILGKADLLSVDWSTLLLIAGGITIGTLLERSGLVKVIAAGVVWNEMNGGSALLLLCLASATLSALMSNTAAVVMLIPLAQSIVPGPATAILVAIAASFGMPFVISTPQNAMVVGEGGVRFGDLFTPGIILMLLGCVVVSLTGPTVLDLVGIR